MCRHQDISYIPVRVASILTNAYVAGVVIEAAERYSDLTLNISFTKGSLTDAQIKIEVSKDGVNYLPLTVDAFTAGANTPVVLTYKLTADSSFSTKPLPILTKYIKISAIGTGTVTSSSLAIDAVLGEI